MVLALRYPDFRELQRFLPKNGYGLVGRISGKRDSGNVDDAVFGALTTMLHENLPLENARRLIVLGEERHLSEGGIDHSLHHLISQNRSVPIDIIKSPIKSTRLICMAVGIEPVPVDRVSFRKFCERLLRASGWKIGFRDRDESIIYCSREKESRAVGLLTRAELTPVNPIVDALLRFRELNRNSVAQILTDFTPSRALADVAVATNIRIFHYSKLDINTN